MSLKEELKNEAKAEKAKFKEMNLSDKLWYIAEYYKFHILAVILLVALTATVGNTVYRNIMYETKMYGYVLNSRSETAFDTTPFTQGFADFMGYDKYQELHLEASYISYGEAATEYSYATMAKVSALVAANDLDFMIMDEENFNHYLEIGAFADLDTWLPEDLHEALKDRFIYETDSEGNSGAYALSLAGTAFADDCNLSDECHYLGIVVNSARGETLVSLLRYLFP